MNTSAPAESFSGPAAGASGLRPVLALEAASKTYPGTPPVPALRQVSLLIQTGELAAIVGPSGSGKSTLLHVMGTLDRPSAGTVRITGLDAACMTDRELAWLRATRIGFVFQQPFLAEHASVLDNVADGLLYSGIRLAQRRQRAAEALDQVGLARKLTARPTQLSGGERQRVGIARTTTGLRRMTAGDLARVASAGLRTRKVRASLSALGIAIGTAAIVAVPGLSSSSEAGLIAQIERLGTNVLTVTPGQSLTGRPARLPAAAPAMIGRISGVAQVQDIGLVNGASVYRNPLIPAIDTNSLAVDAATIGLPRALSTGIADGSYLNAATATEPVTVLGADTASRLGINRVFPGERVWLGGQWFYVAGIMRPVPLDPDLDSAALVGFAAARRYLGFDGHPSTIYVRTKTSQIGDVGRVMSVLAGTANPEDPNAVAVSQPSAALLAQADAQSALDGLFLGLGAVVLLVGAIGVANIMVISVLERRSEIGLRRALGATRADIRVQFLAESILLALAGGLTGVAAGATATASYAYIRNWEVVIPAQAWAGGIGAALLIGVGAGLVPALRATRMSPTQALWAL